jgi:hypothetical protein
MKRVIERCPNCGVEHDDPVGGQCEVCGTQLRYWCRVHGPEIGFMDTAACPRCAAEAARPTPPPRPAPAPPPRPRAPTPGPTYEPPPAAREPRRERPWREGRDPGVVLREHAEDLAPYAAAGAGFLVRLMMALVVVVRSVLGWGFLGAIGGVVYVSTSGAPADLLWAGMAGAMVGGGIGLLVGTIRAMRVLFAQPPSDGRRG